MGKYISRPFAKLFAVAGLLALGGQAACVAETGAEGDTEQTASQGDELAYAEVGFALVYGTGAPPGLWSYNSSGGGINVTSSGTGVYNVTFAGLGGPGGNVQVVAYGSNSSRCKVQGWAPIGGDQLVTVRCHAANGSAVNSPFVVRFSRPDGGYDGNGAYVWSGSASPPLNVPQNLNTPYSWNSTGGTNRLVRAATGRYLVYLPGMPYVTGGSVEVTAYGSGSEHCNVRDWALDLGGETRVEVRCFNTTGAAVSTLFSMNFLGQNQVSAYNYGAHVFADDPTASSYTPSPYYSYNSGIHYTSSCPGWLGENTAGRYSTGYYFVRHSLLNALYSAPHVTANGFSSNYCKLSSWNTSGDGTEVRVRCFNSAGNPTNTTFAETYNSSYWRGPC